VIFVLRYKVLFFRRHYAVQSELMCTDCLERTYAMCDSQLTECSTLHVFFAVSHAEVLQVRMLVCCHFSVMSDLLSIVYTVAYWQQATLRLAWWPVTAVGLEM